MNQFLGGAALVVCVGPGGVGKTSVAAALGIAAARGGRRVCVLTVDPARRLAAALGIGLDNRPTRVPIDAPGELWAAMLDASASFGGMVDRNAPTAEFQQTVYDDPMYRVAVGSLSRSHAYAAMEWLYDAFAREAYDLVVLDTPPASVGVEMFDAPSRMLEMLEPEVFGWFIQPRRDTIVGRVLARGGSLVRKAIEALLGEGPWARLITFLGLLAQMQPGFVERSAAMSARLRRPDTKFVLVSRPESLALADLAQIAQALTERGLPIAATVWNRVPATVDDPGSLDLDAALRVLGSAAAESGELLQAAREARRSAAREHQAASAATTAFAARLGVTISVSVPELAAMIDLADLERIADALVGPMAGPA